MDIPTRLVEEEEEEWEEEEEDEMILELREVWRQSTTTSIIIDESGDSLDCNDTDEIKVSHDVYALIDSTHLQAKLRALRDYVNDLQLSYDELLDTFSQLESAARDKIGGLENKLANAITCAKVNYRPTQQRGNYDGS